MRRACLFVIALGCAGGKSQTKADCDPGRCLDDIAQKVQEHRATARACYDAKPTPEGGRVIINFEIDAAGRVIDASKSVQDGQLEDVEVVACIIDVIKEITFAKSASGKRTRAYHMFEFAPKTKS